MSYWRGYFEHGYEDNYATTITRYVGPTTRTGVRGTLPQPSPSDSNAIWVAPNGSDAAAGTQAAPKLTIAGAIAALTAGKPTVHIFRNGYVGELRFAESGLILPVSRNMQVEEGEIAYIEGNLGLSGTNSINGLAFEVPSSAGTDTATYTNGAGSSTIANCSAWNIGTNTFAYFGLGVGSSTIEYCVGGVSLGQENAATTTGAITNCAIGGGSLDTAKIPIFINQNGSSTVTATFTRCFVYASGNSAVDPVSGQSIIPSPFYIYYFEDAGTVTTNITLESCHIVGSASLLTLYDGNGSRTFATTVTASYCLFATANQTYSNLFGSPTINYTFASTNELSNALIPQLDSLPAFITGSNFYGSSLQWIGKSTINGNAKFFMNSPLIGAGASGVDVNPWDESTALVSSGYTKTTEIFWPASDYKVTVRAINPVNIFDVRGNAHSGYDSIRRIFEFGFGGSGKYASNEDFRKLVKLFMDTGSMKFFPRGQNQNLFVNPNTGVPDATNGDFDSTDNSFAPNGLSVDLIDGNWRGLWITINDASVLKDYYIDSNDDQKLYLIDKLGNGFPGDGTYDFTIEYILVTPEKGDLAAVQEYFSNFNVGGGFREQGDTTTVPFELSGYSIRFSEIEDNEEPQ